MVNGLNLAHNSLSRKRMPDFKCQNNKIQFEFSSDRDEIKLLENNRKEAVIDTKKIFINLLNKRNNPFILSANTNANPTAEANAAFTLDYLT
jgi:hypothetical protein